jgi:hypothetical protein
MRRLLALALSLFATTAQAGELPHDPMVQLLLLGERGPVEIEHDYLFGLWEQTMPLAEKAARMGTTVQTMGKGDYSFACATHDGITLWALSDASNREGEPVVTALINTPATGANIACDALAELELGPMDGEVPGIGATLSALEERYGEVEVSEEGTAHFRSHSRVGDPASFTEMIKTVSYHLSDDIVDAVAYELAAVQ